MSNQFLREFKYLLVETLVGAILGVIFKFLVNPETGAVIFGIGVLFSISRMLICRWFVKEFSTISEAYKLKEEIKEINDEEFIREAILCEEDFLSKLKELSEGEISYDSIGKYLSAAESQVGKTKISMKAVAIINMKEWLDGELEIYLNKQISAIKKNDKLRIERIFYLSDDQKNSEITKRVLKKQYDAGIKIHIVNKNLANIEIPPPFVIYDEKVAIVGNLREDGKIINGFKIVNPKKINDLMDIFNKHLKLNSEKFDGSI